MLGSRKIGAPQCTGRNLQHCGVQRLGLVPAVRYGGQPGGSAMRRGITPHPLAPSPRPGRLQRWRSRALVATGVALLVATIAAGVRQDPVRSAQVPPEAGSGASATEVIAQGLAFFAADAQHVWRVREVTLPAAQDAESADAPAYAFL